MKRGYLIHAPRIWSLRPCHCPCDGAPHGVVGKKASSLMLNTGPQLRERNGLNAALYPMASDILKMGRYIATTINPITIPRNTIMMGSSNDVSEATA